MAICSHQRLTSAAPAPERRRQDRIGTASDARGASRIPALRWRLTKHWNGRVECPDLRHWVTRWNRVGKLAPQPLPAVRGIALSRRGAADQWKRRRTGGVWPRRWTCWASRPTARMMSSRHGAFQTRGHVSANLVTDEATTDTCFLMVPSVLGDHHLRDAPVGVCFGDPLTSMPRWG